MIIWLVHRMLKTLSCIHLVTNWLISNNHDASPTQTYNFPLRANRALLNFPDPDGRIYKLKSFNPTKAARARMLEAEINERDLFSILRTCLVVSGRRMPPALFLGCSSFSTSTRLSDGIRRFAIAARRCFLLGEQVDGCGDGFRWLSRGLRGFRVYLEDSDGGGWMALYGFALGPRAG